MNIFFEYLQERGIWIDVSNEHVKKATDDLLESLTEDDSEFHVVDGEEGDNGQIRYFHNNQLFATVNVYGGDNEDIEFTDYGKAILQEQCKHLLISMISEK